MSKLTLQIGKEQIEKILGITGESEVDLEIKNWVVSEIVRHYAKEVLNDERFQHIKRMLLKEYDAVAISVLKEELKGKVTETNLVWATKPLTLTNKFVEEIKTKTRGILKDSLKRVISEEVIRFVNSETEALRDQLFEELKNQSKKGYEGLMEEEIKKVRASVIEELIGKVIGENK